MDKLKQIGSYQSELPQRWLAYPRLTGLLIVLAVLAGGVLLVSNLAAVKLWNFVGVSVDGGIVLFPLAYIIGDIIVEIYGKSLAKVVILASFALNLLAVVALCTVGLLPEYAGWGHQAEYETIFYFAPRVVAGSLLAYLASQLLNNVIFVKIKQHTGLAKFWLRALGSSAIAKLLDIAVFEVVAFWSVLSGGEFMRQALLAYVAGVLLEIILFPLTLIIVRGLRKYLSKEMRTKTLFLF